MKISLIIPPSPGGKKIIRMIDCSHEAKTNYLWQPNDFIIITSLLRPEDSVFFIDGTADNLNEKAFLKQLKDTHSDLAFFILSSVCWESDLAFFEKSKQYFADAPVFVLGDIFLENAYRRFILDTCDGIVFNPYLLNLPEMAEIRKAPLKLGLPGIVTKAGETIFGMEKTTTTVQSGIPRHELFLKKGYRFPFAKHLRFTTVTTLWGCPFVCTYCTDSAIPPLIRNYEDILRELHHIRRLGVRELFFADKTFGFSRENVIPLLNEMAVTFDFSWTCYFHPQLYSPPLLDMMQKAGCHTIIIGIDSADVSSLIRYRRKVDEEKISDIIAHANRLNISICADFILGLEHEDVQAVIKTIDYAVSLPIDFASFNIAAPLPGSDIRQRLRNSGKLVFGREGFDTSAKSGILGTDRISPEMIKKLREQAFRRFYLRPSYLLRRMRKTTSLEHFMIQFSEMMHMFKKE